MHPFPTLLFVGLGVVYVLLMLMHEFFVLPFLRSYFSTHGTRGARQRQRKFEWACRQAMSYFYAAGSLGALGERLVWFGPQFGSAVIPLQVMGVLMGLLFVSVAWYRWVHAWED